VESGGTHLLSIPIPMRRLCNPITRVRVSILWGDPVGERMAETSSQSGDRRERKGAVIYISRDVGRDSGGGVGE